jgi:AP2 domain/HNH endonuclease
MGEAVENCTVIKTKSKHTKPLPSAEFLRSILRYEKETGNLIWLARRGKDGRPNTKYVGRIAGNIGNDGYRYVMINEENFLTHRIAWKIVTGNDPENEIDHEDRCRSNNKWLNLREATHGENNHNMPVKSHSLSKIKGVRQVPSGKWTSQIRSNGIQYYLGSFDSSDEAKKAHRAASISLYGDMAHYS